MRWPNTMKKSLSAESLHYSPASVSKEIPSRMVYMPTMCGMMMTAGGFLVKSHRLSLGYDYSCRAIRIARWWTEVHWRGKRLELRSVWRSREKSKALRDGGRIYKDIRESGIRASCVMTNKFLKASVGDGRCEPFVNEMSLQKFTRNDTRPALKKY